MAVVKDGASTRRIQVLFGSEEYAVLESISRKTGKSVDALVHEAVEEQFVAPLTNKQRAAHALVSMSIDIGDWPEIKQSLELGKYRSLGARDAIHAAVVIAHHLDGIVSADRVFKSVEVQCWDPAEES